MTKYSNPEFKVVVTPSQDILTASPIDPTHPTVDESITGFAGGQVPLGF